LALISRLQLPSVAPRPARLPPAAAAGRRTRRWPGWSARRDQRGGSRQAWMGTAGVGYTAVGGTVQFACGTGPTRTADRDFSARMHLGKERHGRCRSAAVVSASPEALAARWIASGTIALWVGVVELVRRRSTCSSQVVDLAGRASKFSASAHRAHWRMVEGEQRSGPSARWPRTSSTSSTSWVLRHGIRSPHGRPITAGSTAHNVSGGIGTLPISHHK
jgi:hypothetical protein